MPSSMLVRIDLWAATLRGLVVWDDAHAGVVSSVGVPSHV